MNAERLWRDVSLMHDTSSTLISHYILFTESFSSASVVRALSLETNRPTSIEQYVVTDETDLFRVDTLTTGGCLLRFSELVLVSLISELLNSFAKRANELLSLSCSIRRRNCHINYIGRRC